MLSERWRRTAGKAAVAHVAWTGVVLLAVFLFRWAFALEFALAPVVGGVLTVGLVVLGLFAVGRAVRASAAVRTVTAGLVVLATLVVALYSPLDHELRRILDEVPVPDGGEEVQVGGRSTWLCIPAGCLVSRLTHHDLGVVELHKRQLWDVRDDGWSVHFDESLFPEAGCNEGRMCNLAAAKGRIHLSVEVRADPAGGSLMSVSVHAV